MVVVGPSGSGKTTVWLLLQAALGSIGHTVQHHTMNPKAMPRTQVRGRVTGIHVHVDLPSKQYVVGSNPT